MTVKFVYNITNQNTMNILHLENEKNGNDVGTWSKNGVM